MTSTPPTAAAFHLHNKIRDQSARIAIVGLGYLGLPLAVEVDKRRPVIGFEVKPERVAELPAGRDSTREVTPDELAATSHLSVTDDTAAPLEADILIVTAS